MNEAKQFFHQGKTNGPKFDQEKALKAKSTKELDDLISKLDKEPGSYIKDYVAQLKAERASRVGKLVKEESTMTQSLIQELLSIHEQTELEEAIFPETHYTWFEVKNPIKLSRRGKMETIEKGDVIGLRRATSSEGKYRMVTKKRGPTIIFSVDRAGYDDIKKNTQPLRGSLND